MARRLAIGWPHGHAVGRGRPSDRIGCTAVLAKIVCTALILVLVKDTALVILRHRLAAVLVVALAASIAAMFAALLAWVLAAFFATTLTAAFRAICVALAGQRARGHVTCWHRCGCGCGRRRRVGHAADPDCVLDRRTAAVARDRG